jgi:hypothetical protein
MPVDEGRARVMALLTALTSVDQITSLDLISESISSKAIAADTIRALIGLVNLLLDMRADEHGSTRIQQIQELGLAELITSSPASEQVQAALALAFPGIDFVAYVHDDQVFASWTEGPSIDEVEAIVAPFSERPPYLDRQIP